MADRLQVLIGAYRAYVDTYRQADGTLPPMMRLKLDHTMNVVAAARAIADGEGFSSEEKFVSEAAALLHDTGRYEQLKRYNTFRDSESVDHAVFSHDIVKAKGWLDEWPERDAILTAVLVHNRRDIPDGLDALALTAARTVRDADKLDIFRVLEDRVAHTDWRHDVRAFWNLPTTKAPNPAVVAAIREGRSVDYQHIGSLADFVLVQVGWMRAGLEYVTTRRLCAARGHLAFRRDFLRALGAGVDADALCDLAETTLRSVMA